MSERLIGSSHSKNHTTRRRDGICWLDDRAAGCPLCGERNAPSCPRALDGEERPARLERVAEWFSSVGPCVQGARSWRCPTDSGGFSYYVGAPAVERSVRSGSWAGLADSGAPNWYGSRGRDGGHGPWCARSSDCEEAAAAGRIVVGWRERRAGPGVARASWWSLGAAAVSGTEDAGGCRGEVGTRASRFRRFQYCDAAIAPCRGLGGRRCGRASRGAEIAPSGALRWKLERAVGRRRLPGQGWSGGRRVSRAYGPAG